MALLGILVIVLDLVVDRKGLVLGFAFLGLAAPVAMGLLLLFDLTGSGSENLVPVTSVLSPSLAVDRFSLFFNFLVLAATALVILGSTDYVRRMEGNQGEYFGLILLSATGMMLLVAATELITIYISLELTTSSTFVAPVLPISTKTVRGARPRNGPPIQGRSKPSIRPNTSTALAMEAPVEPMDTSASA